MSYELINRITVKKDGVYISSHSNNDTAPFHSHRIETLSKVYAEEGQKGLDREIFKMIYEYAELRGSHKSIVRYQRVMDCAEGRELYNDYLKERNEKYVALSAEEPITCGSESDKKYEEYDKRLKNNLYIAYAGLAALLDKCYGCAHIGFRFPYASMHPCCNCTRSHTIDYYESKDTGKKPVKKAVKPKADFLVLKAELPMTDAMFCCLVNNYIKTSLECSNCSHDAGGCVKWAKEGKCRAMDKRINENILNFHTGTIEFTTTKAKVEELLKAYRDAGLDKDQWIPEDVNEVIDSYINNWDCTSETNPFADFEKENGFAKSLYKNLKRDVTDAIVYELDWSKVE